MALAVAKPNCPEPSVFNNWLALPSEVGILIPFMLTVPVPAPVSCKSALVVVAIVLSVITTPSIVAVPVELKVVNVPAAGVVAPIAVSSMAPPLMSAFATTTLPVPDADNTRSEFVCVVLISLSVMLMFESIVRLVIATTPVPLGLKTRSSLDLVAEIVFPLKDIPSLSSEEA